MFCICVFNRLKAQPWQYPLQGKLPAVSEVQGTWLISVSINVAIRWLPLFYYFLLQFWLFSHWGLPWIKDLDSCFPSICVNILWTWPVWPPWACHGNSGRKAPWGSAWLRAGIGKDKDRGKDRQPRAVNQGGNLSPWPVDPPQGEGSCWWALPLQGISFNIFVFLTPCVTNTTLFVLNSHRNGQQFHFPPFVTFIYTHTYPSQQLRCYFKKNSHSILRCRHTAPVYTGLCVWNVTNLNK